MTPSGAIAQGLLVLAVYTLGGQTAQQFTRVYMDRLGNRQDMLRVQILPCRKQVDTKPAHARLRGGPVAAVYDAAVSRVAEGPAQTEIARAPCEGLSLMAGREGTIADAKLPN